MSEPSYLTIVEIATMMRVSKMTVYRLVADGVIPAVQIGRSYRVRADEFGRYLAASRVGGSDGGRARQLDDGGRLRWH